MKTNPEFSMYIPTKLFFGCGEINKLSTLPMPGEKALLVVSSGGSMKNLGYLDKIINLLKENDIKITLYDQVKTNPTRQIVMEGSELCSKEKCDFVIALGGGSTIDTAKAIAITSCNKKDFWDFVYRGTGKGDEIKDALPVVVISTTAGTGSEINSNIVISNKNTNEKISTKTDYAYPTISIVDPEIMVSVPSKLTAFQGFQLFFHAVESYLSEKATQISLLYSLEAIRLVHKYLPLVVHDGVNIDARTKLALASVLTGLSQSTSCCISAHSIEHSISTYFPSLPHGAGLIAISEQYFESFKNYYMKKYMKMSEAMNQNKSNRPSDFIDTMIKLEKECDVYDIKLSEFGITPDDFQTFIEASESTHKDILENDPHQLNKREMMHIFKNSYK